MYVDIFLVTVGKSILIYLLGILISKLIGIKLISQVNFFDFIMAVSIGSMIAKIIIDKDYVVFSGLVALMAFTFLTVLTSYINMKSYKIRGIINAKTTILVENGCIIDKNLKKVRISINELMMDLRVKDVFNLEDVQFAILESNGKVSVMVKAEKKPATAEDLNLKVKSGSLINDIIIDGKILEKNLKVVNINHSWLKSQFKKENIENVEEVFYAGIDKDKKLIISKKCKKDYDTKKKYAVE